MQNYVLVSAGQCEGKEIAYKRIVDRPQDNIEVNLKINMLIPVYYITLRHNKRLIISSIKATCFGP